MGEGVKSMKKRKENMLICLSIGLIITILSLSFEVSLGNRIVFLAFGMMLIGGGFYNKKKYKKGQKMTRSGTKMRANIKDTTFNWGKGACYIIHCAFIDKSTNKTHEFRSDSTVIDPSYFGVSPIIPVWYPSKEIEAKLNERAVGMGINVYVNPDDWGDYWVDTDEWLGRFKMMND